MKQDGILGPKTLQKVAAADGADVIEKLTDARLQYYDAIVKRNPTQAKYAAGWAKRAKEVGEKALSDLCDTKK